MEMNGNLKEDGMGWDGTGQGFCSPPLVQYVIVDELLSRNKLSRLTTASSYLYIPSKSRYHPRYMSRARPRALELLP
jgi:hypothetical protein